MGKKFKINIKNKQIANAVSLSEEAEKELQPKVIEPQVEVKAEISPPPPEVIVAMHPVDLSEEDQATSIHDGDLDVNIPKVKARSKSAFEEELHQPLKKKIKKRPPSLVEENAAVESPSQSEESLESVLDQAKPISAEEKPKSSGFTPMTTPTIKPKLGPTGKHVRDLIPPPQSKPVARDKTSRTAPSSAPTETPASKPSASEEEQDEESKNKKAKFKEYHDLKPTKRVAQVKSFDARDKHGLRMGEEERHHRKRRGGKGKKIEEMPTIRPDKVSVRIPIAIKDLASAMKLKASELISKLFMDGIAATINDFLEDETIIQLLGHHFNCEITIDTSEEKRVRITDKTIQQEIKEVSDTDLKPRAPVIAFMGHVDHGKTSLIDRIRSSERAAQEAGQITQHIGAFLYHTAIGPIAILDTPGHAAFSEMRARGANVTDIVVLVVAGDEGIRQQTIEAINHAKAAGVTLVVAINKCDKPNFNAEEVYRQLMEQNLVVEPWGGQLICVNCSAKTGEGVDTLLEMLALQSEVLELRADTKARARGTVLESEMHKGMGAVATILVQNGTLRHGDSLVIDHFWGRVKTMRDEFSRDLTEAGPSTPVLITGLSGLPEAGQEFIVVSSEKEARDIASIRQTGTREKQMLKSRVRSVETLFEEADAAKGKKTLNLILRADVQGSLEALKNAILAIDSNKVQIEIVLAGVGEISESDVQLAAASKASIIGFHTQVESHAEQLLKQYSVIAHTHGVIYHAIDKVKELMEETLDKLEIEEERGKAEVLAIFKSSHFGVIAGCKVTEGTIARNHRARLVREGKVIWKGGLSSLRRVQEDVKEVSKGFECGIVLQGNPTIQEKDEIQAYEVIYKKQEL